ncbi:deoxyribodipyrimidine photo-lyase [Rosenbergiella australiborealis]|uniref:Deoxyribodipyrimidine photo-lyase n=1 Tax=Rosenbergiella australiborealis TaxID=1544696 RepID=A0ABS5T415_9GAMM|nr:deoxyribodipyrimidine photo-lyase [Rosenbergiella australiborealis]MBT0727061.1 deoxyribodipyrimidine photo-lyase [Rosenbergiella australiborealis]
MSQQHLVWFRHDLRLRDNPALSAACLDNEAEVLALWCITPDQWQHHNVSPRQLNYQYDALRVLQQDLRELGIPLLIIESKDYHSLEQDFIRLCAEHKIDKVFYNHQYELNERQRDQRIEALCDQNKIICQGFNDATIFPPGTVLTGQGKMYHVFTPFARAVLKKLVAEEIECSPLPHKRKYPSSVCGSTLRDFSSPEGQYDTTRFPLGHDAALHRLRDFSTHQVEHYADKRDLPADDDTSLLSAALAIGLLSPKQCVKRIVHDYPNVFEQPGGPATWLNELIWRDFYRHLLVSEPQLCRYKPFQTWTDHIQWQNNQQQFTAWCEGNTGFPIVDAGMRQLNKTGWMHNRLRMVCASFLVKDLLIDWRWGERYFSQQLIDGDLAANNGGWQWAASTGTDAAPYFRIFNPTRQGERFDPQGKFIRQWLPELSAVPEKSIHEPWLWADKLKKKLDYARPIVEHRQAREATLRAFEDARKYR